MMAPGLFGYGLWNLMKKKLTNKLKNETKNWLAAAMQKVAYDIFNGKIDNTGGCIWLQ